MHDAAQLSVYWKFFMRFLVDPVSELQMLKTWLRRAVVFFSIGGIQSRCRDYTAALLSSCSPNSSRRSWAVAGGSLCLI